MSSTSSFHRKVGVCSYLRHDLSYPRRPCLKSSRSDLIWLAITFNSLTQFVWIDCHSPTVDSTFGVIIVAILMSITEICWQFPKRILVAIPIYYMYFKLTNFEFYTTTISILVGNSDYAQISVFVSISVQPQLSNDLLQIWQKNVSFGYKRLLFHKPSCYLLLDNTCHSLRLRVIHFEFHSNASKKARATTPGVFFHYSPSQYNSLLKVVSYLW